MTKKPVTKKAGFNEDLDFSDFIPASYEDEMYDEEMFNMFHHLVDANKDQMQIALELTKFIFEKKASSESSKEEILTTFKQATQIVAENSPLRQLLEKMEKAK